QHVRHLRWMSKDRVALWSFRTNINFPNAAKWISKERSCVLPIGLPKELLFGEGLYFVGYGEDQYLRATDDNIESQLVAAFDETGQLLFGMQEFLRDANWRDSPIEFQSGCITEKSEAIFCLYGAQGLWRMSPVDKMVKKIPIPLDSNRIVALSELDNT